MTVEADCLDCGIRFVFTGEEAEANPLRYPSHKVPISVMPLSGRGRPQIVQGPECRNSGETIER